MSRAGLLIAAPLFILLLVCESLAQQSASYDQPATYPAAQVLPKELVRGPHFQTLSPVAADGYMYRVNVQSDYGPFDVTGIGALRKLVREIGAIAKLREIKASKAFASAVKDSASGPLSFAKNLITHPVDTATGVPKGAYKLMEDTADVVTSEKNPSDDPAYKKVALVSGRKREYAAQLGVDVYSSNPVLQKELNAVGWAAAVGNLTVSAALLPVGGTAGAVVSATRWSNALDEYVKTEPASRLRIIAEGKLTDAGISADLAKRFVNQTRFTPRQYVILAESLTKLGPGPSRGREAFLEAAINAQDEVEANFFASAAQILRGYHEAVSPIGEIRMSARVPVARAGNGTVVVPIPVDFLMWSPALEQRSQAVTSATGPGKVEAWLTGTASPLAKRRLAERGIVVVDRVGQRFELVD
jgi:hypothetical protein